MYGQFSSNLNQTVRTNNAPDYEKMDKFMGRLVADLIEYFNTTPNINPDFQNIVSAESLNKKNLDELISSGKEGFIFIKRDIDTANFDYSVRLTKGTKSHKITYSLYIRLENKHQELHVMHRMKRMLDTLTHYLTHNTNTYSDTVSSVFYSTKLNANEVIDRIEFLEEKLDTSVFTTGVLRIRFCVFQND